MNEILFLTSFLVVVIIMLSLDLGVFHKKDHVISLKEAAIWTTIWIGMAFIFYGVIFFHAEWIHGIQSLEDIQRLNLKHGHGLRLDNVSYTEALTLYRKAMSLEYLTGYLIEKSLSIDNIFVMIMIFISFGVDRIYFHRVLFYGILGAIIFRFIFIFSAAALIQKFHWILLLFGVILIYTGIRMFITRNKKENIDVERHPIVRFLSKHGLTFPHFDGHNFFVKEGKKWLATPLFIVLLIIEFSDIIFAFDSIPAIFSVTQDPYIVFFSNIFAILGLRSLFFLLENIIHQLRYLKIGLAFLLLFIGIKMLLPDLFNIHIPTFISLMIILFILSISILASIIINKIERKKKTI